jgi:hypothetical protein
MLNFQHMFGTTQFRKNPEHISLTAFCRLETYRGHKRVTDSVF